MSNKRSLVLLLSVIFFVLGVEVASTQAGFPHSKAKHRTLECKACHTVTMAKPDVKAFPGHAACTSCHDFSEEATLRRATFCGICHLPKAEPALFRFPKPGVPTEFGLQFLHLSHSKPFPNSDESINLALLPTQNEGMKCIECHSVGQISTPVATSVAGRAAASGEPEITLQNAHANCFRCHGEKLVHSPSMTQCAGCHVLSGTIPPHLYGIVSGFKHADHSYDIRPKKKADLQAGLKRNLCTECHVSVVQSTGLQEIKLPEAGYCAECHNGKLGLPDPLTASVLKSLRR